MNLIRFLTIGCLIAIVFGEFIKYPFGQVGNALNILDILVAVTVSFFLIWKVGIKKQLEIPKPSKVLLGFSVIGLLSLVFNYNFSGVLYLIRFIFYSLFFWIGYQIAVDGKRDVIQNTLISVGVIIAVLGGIQLWLFPDLTFLTEFGYDPHIFRLSSTFLDPNFVGAFLTIVYAVCLIKYFENKDRLLPGILLILFLAIILTFSRSAWIFFAIVNLFTIWFLPKKIVVGLIVLALLSVIFVPRIQQRILGAVFIDISASERLMSWEKGINLFKLSPITGIGFNNIKTVSIEQGLIRPFTPDGGNSGNGIDSSWLLVLVTTGVIGIVSYGYFYLSLIVGFIKKSKNNQALSKKYLVLTGILVGLLIESQFINSLFYPQIMLIFFIIMGIYYADSKQNS